MSITFRGFKGLVVFVAAGLCLMSCGTSSRPAGILLATSQGATLIDSFGVNLNTGALTQIHTAAQVPSGTAPSAIILDSTGSTAYVANAATSSPTTSAGSISAYKVNSDGTLAAVGSNAATGVNPVALAMDPAGKFLFVVNKGSNDVSVFSIGSPGNLTEVGKFATGSVPIPPSNAAPTPAGIAVAASGNFVYVANQGQDTISAFSFDTGSGVLTPIPGSPFPAATAPSGLAALLTGSNTNIVFVANQGANSVSVFNVNTDGSLMEITGSPYGAGLGPIALTVDPSKNFLYVADTKSNQLSAYRVNPGTGALTTLTPSVVSTGVSPVAVAIRTSAKSTSISYLYVADIGGDTISGFQLTVQSGALAPLTPAATDSRPSGIAVK